MTATQGNPVGFEPVMDGGNPRIITAKAAGAISGGALVYASGAAGNVSSGANSFSADDIAVLTNASGANFTGVALQTVASGALVGVATRAACILLSTGTTTAGTTVITGGGNGVLTGTTAGHVLGRAYTSAGSEGYAVVDVGRS